MLSLRERSCAFLKVCVLLLLGKVLCRCLLGLVGLQCDSSLMFLVWSSPYSIRFELGLLRCSPNIVELFPPLFLSVFALCILLPYLHACYIVAYSWWIEFLWLGNVPLISSDDFGLKSILSDICKIWVFCGCCVHDRPSAILLRSTYFYLWM